MRPRSSCSSWAGETATRRKMAAGSTAGYWRDEREFPLARTRFTPFYFHADGTLSTDQPSEAEVVYHLSI